ncbi:hypothetical protein BOX15_Mlig033051g1, partial [Macrostomum lignano]
VAPFLSKSKVQISVAFTTGQFKMTTTNSSYTNGELASRKDSARRLAANMAVDENLQNCQTIGIGSGRTMVFVVERIAELLKQKSWSVKCVPTSYQAKQLIREHGMPLAELEYCTAPLDWAVDGADEVDANLALIKGGGGCLLQEKIVDTAANSLVIVCDEAKISRQFGERWRAGVPIEVVPMAWALVKRQIETRFGGRAVLRESAGKMGPVVTDNGNFLIDWQFDAQQKWEQVDRELHMMPGLVETGLFIGKASAVYVGKFDGGVEKLLPPDGDAAGK